LFLFGLLLASSFSSFADFCWGCQHMRIAFWSKSSRLYFSRKLQMVSHKRALYLQKYSFRSSSAFQNMQHLKRNEYFCKYRARL
jgi:hypothetical protein